MDGWITSCQPDPPGSWAARSCRLGTRRPFVSLVPAPLGDCRKSRMKATTMQKVQKSVSGSRNWYARPCRALQGPQLARSRQGPPFVHHHDITRRQSVFCAADRERKAPVDEREDGDDLLIEQQIKKRQNRSPRPTPNVVVQRPQPTNTQAQEAGLETAAVRFLAGFFVFILLEGVVLAGSGFLPESADQFAQAVLYPSYTPTVGVFLLCSTLYGLWKSKG